MHEKIARQKEGDFGSNEEGCKADDFKNLRRKLSRQDSKVDKRVVEIMEQNDQEEYQSMCSLDKIGKETAIQERNSSKNNTKTTKAKSLPHKMATGCIQTFGLKLLCYFPFLSLALLSLATFITHVIYQVFLSSLAEDKGYTPGEIRFLLMALSCADIPSKGNCSVNYFH